MVQLKVFDRVDHKYLELVFVADGFNPNFYEWITTLYSDIETIVMMNVLFSEPF